VEETVAAMQVSSEAVAAAAMDSKVAQAAQAREAGVARFNKWV
jgi:hypothetical protein